MAQIDLYLASQSPRRRDLLAQIGLRFEVLNVETDETPLPTEAPLDYVERVVRNKVQAGLDAADGSQPVLAADTTVVCEGQLYGKPSDRADGARMLSHLAGRQHEVMTAVAVATAEQQQITVQISKVQMAILTATAIDAYWDTGEPCDKAGGYGIQSIGAAFVTHLEGSYSGVMGLPLYETIKLLDQFGIAPLTAGGIR